MSEIRVTTLSDTAGSNSSTTAQIQQGRAKAWVNWGAQGTVAVRDSFGINSITDNGEGKFAINFNPTFSNANYAVSGACGNINNSVAGTNAYISLLGGGKGTGRVQTGLVDVLCGYTDNVSVDYPMNMVYVHGSG